jgi:membrane protease YdiL (CAAX protease family)
MLGPLVAVAVMLYGPYLWATARKEPLDEYGLALRPRKRAFAGSLVAAILTLVPLTAAVYIGWPAQTWPRAVPFRAVLSFASAGLVAAVSEEVFFRGWVQTLLGRILHPVLAVVVASALFALSHLVFRSDPFYLLTFFPGLVMGWLRLKHGDIAPSILYHFLGNLWAIWFFPRP